MIGGRDGWLLDNRDANVDRAPSPELQANIGRLIAAIQAQGVVVVLPVFPARALVAAQYLDEPQPGESTFDAAVAQKRHDELLGWLRGTGATVLDMLAPALSIREPPYFYLRRDHHVTPTGTKLAAEAVATAIRAKGIVLPSLPTTATPAGTRSLRDEGRLKMVETYCGESPAPPEAYTIWKVTSERPTLDLVSDVGPAKVVLVGTSISGRPFQFPEFLSDALDADVLGVFTTAGGILSALQEYLRSPEWQASRPTVLVWEFAHSELFRAELDGAPNPNHPAIFDEVIPSAYGDCGGTNSPSRQGPVVDGAIDLVAPTDVLHHYLFVESSNTKLEGFDLQLEYESSGTRTHHFVPATRVATHGRFFLTLPPGELLSARAIFPADTGGTFTARVCTVPQSQL